MTDRPAIIESLNVDIALEHGAIVQYVMHALQLRDTGLGEQVLAMAREEMWHMHWLADALFERQAEASLGRADIFVRDSIVSNLRADIAAEDRALAHYEVTLGLVGGDDPALAALLRRIMDDERHHHAHFTTLAGTVDTLGETAVAATPHVGLEVLPAVGPGIQAKYQALLQHLWCQHGCGDAENAETYFELAVDHMRHLHWLAEHLAGLGVPLPPEPVDDTVTRVTGPATALDAARAWGRVEGGLFAELAPQVVEPAVVATFERIAFQREYHRGVLDRMDRD